MKHLKTINADDTLDNRESNLRLCTHQENQFDLLKVNTFELMKIWGEFVECYHGVNFYGGDECEIYAYRFHNFIPNYHNNPHRGGISILEAEQEIFNQTKRQLVDLVEMFCNEYNREATIDGLILNDYSQNKDVFSYRVHVKIIRKKG